MSTTIAPALQPIVISQYQVLLDDIKEAKRIVSGQLHYALRVDWEALK